MASIQQDGILPISFLANEDLSAAQYYCVKAASLPGYVRRAVAGCAPYPIGVLQDNNGSNAGDAVSVKMFGITKAWVAACDAAESESCPIQFGDMLVCNASGVLVRAGSFGTHNAMALGAIATGCYAGIIDVFFYGPTGACTVSAS